MRHVAAWLGLVLLLAGLACTPRWNFMRKDKQDFEDQHAPAPTAAQLVEYLNENSKRLQCLRCQDLEVNCGVGLQSLPTLHGQMVCQQPRNFSMTGKLFGKDEVVIGSNQEEFWYWVRRGDPYQVHCSYRDLEQGKLRAMPFPFRPDWLLETLGMSTYGPPERYQLLDEPPYVKLVERARSPQGTMVRKVIVMRRRPVASPNPQVTEFLLLNDATGKEICSAKILQSQVLASQLNRDKGALVPRQIVLNWPEQKLKLTMRLDTSTAQVDFPPNFPAFVRRPLQGVPSFDLASGRVDGQGTSLLRAGFTGR
jgi:hypothetical protein